MLLVLVVVLAALGLAVALGGGLQRLGALRLRDRRLVVGALAVQLTGALVGGPAHAVGLVLSALLVTAFLARNRGVRGTGLVAGGLLLNALVVGLNGAMPLSAAAAGRAGVATDLVAAGLDPRHELSGRTTKLAGLGDVVPVPLPLLPQVVSPGDLLVAAGLGQLVLLAVGGGAPRPLPVLPPPRNEGDGPVPRRPVPRRR